MQYWYGFNELALLELLTCGLVQIHLAHNLILRLFEFCQGMAL